MKKLSSKITALLLIVVMMTMVVGCGKTEEVKEETTGAVTEEATTEAAEEETAMKEKIKLKVMVLSEDTNRQTIYNDYYSAKIGEAFPDYEVEFELPGSSDAYESKLKIYNASGELPDIFWGQDIVYQAGNALPLTDIIIADGFLDTFSNPSALIPASDGEVYCLNSGTDSFFAGPLYYNKAIFEEVGIEAPTNFEELVAVSETLVAEGYLPISIMAWAVQNFFFSDLITMDDYTNMVKLQKGEIDFNDPAIIEASNKLMTLVDAGAFPENVTAIEYQVHVDMFNKGEAAMLYHPLWVIPAIDETMDLGYVYLPEFGGEKVVNAWGGATAGGFMVSKNSENTEAAVKVAEWLVTQDAEYFSEIGNAVALDGYAVPEDSHEIVLEFYNRMIDDETVKIPNLPTNYMTQAVSSEYGVLLDKLIYKLVTPEEFSAEFNELYTNQ